ncbi:NAD-dependent epimerase/dehydratase family protein [Candidatus Pelagibacter sp. Uisw_106]|jgi:nucleoside-diphosphate-sugar epimerase|uniref:NAD-dependent epimerase/dehydratase family protein n=1 Tax=Candidatus Pelagibacter sp. Uisw_106 TaxID=3230984 RepID=UPI00233203DB|nr:SDR family oxidoreductase [Candidatus Pelagibacter sp.]
MKKIFITGGAGYVGSQLVPKLLELGYFVTVLDLMIYGENILPVHENLKTIKGDIRNTELLEKNIPGNEIVLHLACISNDPSFELNPSLGKSINLDAFEPLVKVSLKNDVNRFIYASSSSVYGIKKEKNVTEDMKLEPLTDYSKFKGDCEKILNSYKSDNFITTTIRPSTVCGYAKRQRLDLVVNILTNHAFYNREIKVFGGDQLRPNVHITDMIDSYLAVIDAEPNIVNGEIFNVGFRNQTVNELASDVKKVIGEDVKIVNTKSDDNRSYHVSSEKIKNILGFSTKYTVRDAVLDLQNAFEKKLLTNTFDNEYYYNIKRMNNINLK